MKLLNFDYSSDRQLIDNQVDIVIEKLSNYIQGTTKEFFFSQNLKPEIEALSQESKIELFYSVFDEYSDAVSLQSVCENEKMKSPSGGCDLSDCCKLHPDVYFFEKERLNTLPSSMYQHHDYCRFFDFKNRICSIYQYRPFSCRMFMNFENDSRFCTNACQETKSLKNTLPIFAPPFLGKYCGPYSGI
jgi:Fe-S-cluster containining protein